MIVGAGESPAPFIVMGVISSLIDLGGNVLDNYAEDKRQQLNRQWQSGEREAMQQYQTGEREAMQQYQTGEREAQNEWNLEQWNRENEFNSPLQQRMRLEAAGLNPNMMFGGSGDIASASALQGSFGSAPSASAPSDPSPASYPVGSAFGNTVSHTIQNLMLEEDLKHKRLENGMFTEITESQIENLKSQAYKNFRDGDLQGWALKFKNEVYDALVSKTNVDVDIAIAEYERVKAMTSNIEKDTEFKGEQINTEIARQTELESSASKMDQEAAAEAWRNLFRDAFHIDPSSQPVSMLIQGLLGNSEQANNVMQSLIDSLRGLAGLSDNKSDNNSWWNNVTGQTGMSNRERRRLLKRRTELYKEYEGKTMPDYVKREIDYISASLGD